jgi:hypothetical protein
MIYLGAMLFILVSCPTILYMMMLYTPSILVLTVTYDYRVKAILCPEYSENTK